MVRTVKRERDAECSSAAETRKRERDRSSGDGCASTQGATEKRVLRSQYLAIKNLINDEREDITGVDSGKFKSIITEVDNLHQCVQEPRDQVADAEALLDIANTLLTSVKSHRNDGATPSDFVAALLRNFGQQDRGAGVDNANVVSWKDVGLSVSHIFKRVPGCCTMIGPMNSEMKQRKVAVHRKRTKPTESDHPAELNDSELEEKTDTDKTMATMFNILVKKRSVRLENLVLNRVSFAQTVENIFALSFLVKDGRAEVSVKDNGHHLVCNDECRSTWGRADASPMYNGHT